jgi:protein-disulfide isomerase-like protein with CxxC motif
MSTISITHFTDPGCPWAYSASPAMAVLRWRYGSQLDWRLVTIGLAEDPKRYEDAGYTPTAMSAGQLYFRRYGMPFAREPRERIAATSRACRAIVATRTQAPGREHEALRALQFGWFTTRLLLDEDRDIAEALQRVDGIDIDSIVGAIDDEQTLAAYEADKQETRAAAGGPTEFQGKARQTDGPVRYSAPSLVFENEAGVRLEAGGFQLIEAYDVIVANLDPKLERRPEAPNAGEALRDFPDGLVTAEVAAIMTPNNGQPDRENAERELIGLLGEGAVVRTALGDDALWQLA